MRLTFGIGKNIWLYEGAWKHARIQSQQTTEVEDEEEFDQAPPVDPTGTNGAHMELSPQVIYDSASSWRFGFHGSEIS